MRDYARIYHCLQEDLGPWLNCEPFMSSDMTDKQSYARALIDSFYKKLCPDGNTSAADAAALEKFQRLNNQISGDPFEFDAQNEVESHFFDYFISNLNRALGFEFEGDNFDLEFIRNNMNVGPGSAQKADSSSMVSKLFCSDISYYGDEYLISLYRAAISETGLWAEAELLRFSEFRFVKVKGGKLFFAPKNAEISRTCCTEASLEMLFQKACGAFIESRLRKHFGINLSVQPDYNRELARLGSIDGTFGTMDLVSASDSISLQLILRVLDNGPLKDMLLRARSKNAVLPDGSEVELRMISTMGNGFTFPLQTIIFASAVRAVYQLMGFPCRCPRTEFAVFGDDIIVRREAFDFTRRMLNKLGFEVNAGKSFNTGGFRESCGTDWHNGLNVRGVYVRSLETPQQICSCLNRLVRWCSSSGIMLPVTVRFLLTLFPRGFRVPRSLSDDAGLHVPFELTIPKVTNAYWFRFRAFKRKVNKVDIPEVDGTSNPSGFGVGYLAGHIRRRDVSLTDATQRNDDMSLSDWGASISIRDRPGANARYTVYRSAIPYWDWPGLAFSGVPDLTNKDYEDDSRWREPSSCNSWKKVAMALLY